MTFQKTETEKKKIPLNLYLKYVLGRKLLYYWYVFIHYLQSLYTKLYLDEIVFFILFLFHRYSPRQFDPGLIKENYKVLLQLRQEEGLDSTRKGKLFQLLNEKDKKGFFWKNFLTFGARQKRVEKAVFFTYLTMTLEVYNPFDRKVLLKFLERKIGLLERLLDKIKTINGKTWNREDVLFHISIFRRNSLLQDKIIQQMHQAVRRQKTPEIVIDAQKAMDRGLFPLLITRGCSGSYWIRSTKKEIAGLFKPFDEEIHAPNNPGGPRLQGAMGQRKTRRGIRIGESAHREVAAFLVDEFFGFGMVPKTYYATFTHSAFFIVHEDRYASRRVNKTKYGSFQEFLSGFVSLDKVPTAELETFPLEEFQLLMVLDLILGNTDRNAGNILVGENKLAAVDHGLCFPDFVDSYSLWYWSYYERCKTPLYPSFLELLKNFPYEELGIKLKKNCFISDRAMHRMRERITLFLEATDQGLTPDKMEGLLIPEYLFPLRGLGFNLSNVAKEQVHKYIEAGMPKKKRLH